MSKPPIVCDNGTGFVKCGFAGDNFPAHIFPSIIGRPVIRAEEKIQDLDNLFFDKILKLCKGKLTMVATEINDRCEEGQGRQAYRVLEEFYRYEASLLASTAGEEDIKCTNGTYIAELCIFSVYLLELVVKLGAYGIDYFADGWNRLDFLVLRRAEIKA